MAARRVGKRALAASIALHALLVVLGTRSFRSQPSLKELPPPDQLEVEIVTAPVVAAEGVEAPAAPHDDVKQAPRSGGMARFPKTSEPSSSDEETALAPGEASEANAAPPSEAASSASARHLT